MGELRCAKIRETLSSPGEFASRLGTMGELLVFLRQRKLWWLIPLMVVILLVGVRPGFGQAAACGLLSTPASEVGP
jgi:hypothetical protein